MKIDLSFRWLMEAGNVRQQCLVRIKSQTIRDEYMFSHSNGSFARECAEYKDSVYAISDNIPDIQIPPHCFSS
ncbi:MAG: hypothetical protein J6M22_05710 [Firmicutes bacterium]|nr:hypothetical protein [Bacillota bacterium]